MKCKTCNNEEAVTGTGQCKKCWRRDYRQKNKEHIRKVSQARYLKTRDKRIKGVKDWHKRNPDYNKNRMKKRYVEEYELNLIRQKTKAKFSHLKVACIECKRMDVPLEFHHLEPFVYDNFAILCPDCHRKAHGRLLVEIKPEEQEDLKRTQSERK